jgi:hypothetical protein
MRRALNWLTGCWRMSPDAFVCAILDHLETGGRVFRKFEQAGTQRLLPDKFQASASLTMMTITTTALYTLN